MNLLSFERIVDDLGRIDINLPRAIDGRAQGSRDTSRYFPAGPRRLGGYRTMILARLRPDGDFERSATQDLILDSAAAKILSPSVLPQIFGLIEAT